MIEKAFGRLIPTNELIINHCFTPSCIRFFSAEPDAKIVYGFPKDMDPNCAETLKNPRIIKKARWFIRIFVQMIDKALETCLDQKSNF
jgi:hypothetical protein